MDELIELPKLIELIKEVTRSDRPINIIGNNIWTTSFRELAKYPSDKLTSELVHEITRLVYNGGLLYHLLVCMPAYDYIKIIDVTKVGRLLQNIIYEKLIRESSNDTQLIEAINLLVSKGIFPRKDYTKYFCKDLNCHAYNRWHHEDQIRDMYTQVPSDENLKESTAEEDAEDVFGSSGDAEWNKSIKQLDVFNLSYKPRRPNQTDDIGTQDRVRGLTGSMGYFGVVDPANPNGRINTMYYINSPVYLPILKRVCTNLYLTLRGAAIFSITRNRVNISKLPSVIPNYT